MKIKKVNIGFLENPKFSNIGDYWDEETVAKIKDLLHEYQHLFPTNVLDMKGILGDLGEMNHEFNTIIHFLSIGYAPEGMSTNQNKHLVVRAADYTLIAGHLYKLDVDEVLRCCVFYYE